MVKAVVSTWVLIILSCTAAAFMTVQSTIGPFTDDDGDDYMIDNLAGQQTRFGYIVNGFRRNAIVYSAQGIHVRYLLPNTVWKNQQYILGVQMVKPFSTAANDVYPNMSWTLSLQQFSTFFPATKTYVPSSLITFGDAFAGGYGNANAHSYGESGTYPAGEYYVTFQSTYTGDTTVLENQFERLRAYHPIMRLPGNTDTNVFGDGAGGGSGAPPDGGNSPDPTVQRGFWASIFIPQKSSVDDMQDRVEQLTTWGPFGYYNTFRSSFQNRNPHVASYQIPIAPLPVLGNQPLSLDLSPFGDIWLFLRSLLVGAMYIAFAWFIIKRASKSL